MLSYSAVGISLVCQSRQCRRNYVVFIFITCLTLLGRAEEVINDVGFSNRPVITRSDEHLSTRYSASRPQYNGAPMNRTAVIYALISAALFGARRPLPRC